MTTYSRKMQAIFHRAQLEAERFGSPFLETWHVLLAMVEVPGSVAYLTFTDFEETFRIVKCKLRGGFPNTAEKVIDIGTVQVYGTFPQVPFFRFIADRFKNIIVHNKTS